MLFLSERSACLALSRYLGRRPNLYGYRGEIVSSMRREADGSCSRGYRVRLKDMDDRFIGFLPE